MDCLVVDEISMVSSHTLDKINKILQLCKGNENIMGGVQRIFCGDFLQLPPVNNFDDPGETAIMADRFELYVPHKVILTKVINLDKYCKPLLPYFNNNTDIESSILPMQ